MAGPALGRGVRLLVAGDAVVHLERAHLEILAHAGDVAMADDASDAGLDVRHYKSGSSVHRLPHLSKCGNRYLRRALFMPALVASRFDPSLRACYQQLLARGKHKRQALAALMRKLLHAIYGMFRHQQPYRGSLLCPALAEVA